MSDLFLQNEGLVKRKFKVIIRCDVIKSDNKVRALEVLGIALNAFFLEHSGFSEHPDPGDVGYKIAYV